MRVQVGDVRLFFDVDNPEVLIGWMRGEAREVDLRETHAGSEELVREFLFSSPEPA